MNELAPRVVGRPVITLEQLLSLPLRCCVDCSHLVSTWRVLEKDGRPRNFKVEACEMYPAFFSKPAIKEPCRCRYFSEKSVEVEPGGNVK